MTQLVPEGRYIARATAVDFDYSRAKGTPYVHVWFETKAELYGVGWDGYFTEKTSEKTAKSLVSLGYVGTNPEEFKGGNPASLCPNEVEVVVRHEEFNGQVRSRVDAVFPVGTKPDAATVAAQKNKYAALFASVHQEMGIDPSKLAPPKVEATGDEIPF